jgi:hypothetical protein
MVKQVRKSMSEHHEHTEFLKHCLRYDTSSERDHMLKMLVHLQQELRIFRRATNLLIVLMVPAAGALFFSNFLLASLSASAQRQIVNLLVAILLGSVICLLAFVILRCSLRRKLFGQREKCRELVKRLLEEKLELGEKRKLGKQETEI